MRSSSWAVFAAALLNPLSAEASDFPDCAKGPLANNTVCDPKASPADRAAALVAAMNINEKLANLVDQSKGAPRLGLPAYGWWSEALHGVARSPAVSFAAAGEEFSHATSFPMPILLSAAFDDDLIHKVASVIGDEARAFGNGGRSGLDFWTPNINPYKDPRWGRGAETPGEDPFRIQGYVKALLAGLEGDKEIRKIVATCKHFAAYDLEKWHGIERHDFDAIVSLQDLSEYYLPPFQECARDSNVGSIMCSYNRLNGTPACASTYLMTDILREHWGWKKDDNFITSDCNAIQDFLPKYHNFSATPAKAAAAAYIAGTDTVCEAHGYPPYTDVTGAYNQSLLSEQTIDIALKRLYHGLVKARYFDPAAQDPYRSLSWSNVNTKESQALAAQSAVDGIVLLKNEKNALPIDLQNKSVALIGHWANATWQMLGQYSGIPPYYHSPLYAAQQRNLSYTYATGPVGQAASANDSWTRGALEAASKADVILYFGGNDVSIAEEGQDRESIAWPGAQLALLQKLSGLGKRLVVVQLGDLSDDTPLLNDKNVSAVLWAGYPGQSGGTAVFDILTGKSAPAGRLPITQYPASYAEAVPLTDMALRPGTGKNGSLGRTYRWFDKPVLPFGHGLHYTEFEASFGGGNASHNGNSTGASAGAGGKSLDGATFAIADLLKSCDEKYKDKCALTSGAQGNGTSSAGGISIAVRNKGSTTSDFVALAFLAGEYGPAPHPRKTLASYARLRGVAGGKEVRAELPALKLGSLARVDESGNTVLYPGKYRLLLDEPTQSEVQFTLTGEEAVLDKFPQPK